MNSRERTQHKEELIADLREIADQLDAVVSQRDLPACGE